MAPRFSPSCTSSAALTLSPCRLPGPGGGAELGPPAATLLLEAEGAVLVSVPAAPGAEAGLPPPDGPLGLGRQVPVVKKLPTAATREPSTPDMPRMWRSLCWRLARMSPSRASVPSSCSRCLASSSAVCTPVCSDSYSSSTPLHQSEVSIQLSPPITAHLALRARVRSSISLLCCSKDVKLLFFMFPRYECHIQYLVLRTDVR